MPTGTVETVDIVKTPAFTYRGFNIPSLEVPAQLIDDLNTGEPAYKLAPKSTPLSWTVGLYMVGRDLMLGESDAEALPEPIREAGKMVYTKAQAREGEGIWHKDAVLIEPGAGIKGSVRPGNDYVAARFFKGIEGFEKTDDGWKINPTPDTEESRIWVPYGDGRFIVPTSDGAYNPITGTPFETIADREKAIKIWADAELTEKQAGREVSRFYRGNGVHAVYSWSSDSSGPLCVLLDNVPRFRGSNAGSSALSRSAERSEAPKNK